MQASPAQTPTSIEDEVLSNLRGQALGAGKVDDLALPEPFLRRVADRIVRTSFEERYRAVVTDEQLAQRAREHEKAAASETANSNQASETGAAPTQTVVIVGATLAAFVAIFLAARRRTRAR